MILDAIMFVAYSVLGLIIELFPSADTATVAYINSQFSALKSGLDTINWFFPIDQLYSVLGIVFTIELVLLGTRVAMWLTENVSLGIFKSPK